MAKITIEINDEPGRDEIKLEIKCSVPWATLQAKAISRTLSPGAEHVAYDALKHVTEQLARRRITLHVPAPKVIVPSSWKYMKRPN